MPAPRVAVIVLNYRGEQVLRPCLAALEKAIGPADRVLVVDNGDEAVLLAEMQREFPWVHSVSTGSNLGFAAGMNFGIRSIQKEGAFDAFWLMNNDAKTDPNGLEALKQAWTLNGGSALYSPLIFSDPAGRPWFSGGKIDFLWMRTTHVHDMPSDFSPYETEFLTGCALFVPRRALEQIGFLDERYFLYYEDAEYSTRALRNGLKLWVVPRARMIHTEESQHRSAKTYWLVRSGVEFFLRESRGGWKFWIALYFPLRRLKNWFDIKRGKTIANEVKRAYTDVSL